MSDATKNISLKFVGTNREAETLSIEPGTTVRDILQTVGLATGFSITNPTNPDQQFNLTDNIYAAVEDGDMLAVVADIDAGFGEEV